MRLRIYISAPLTNGGHLNGLTGEAAVKANVAAAMAAGHELMRLGYAPFVPHLTYYMDPDGEVPHAVWLAVDEPWVLASHAVLRLPGESKGADMETAWARQACIPVFESIEQLREALPPDYEPLSNAA